MLSSSWIRPTLLSAMMVSFFIPCHCWKQVETDPGTGLRHSKQRKVCCDKKHRNGATVKLFKPKAVTRIDDMH